MVFGAQVVDVERLVLRIDLLFFLIIVQLVVTLVVCVILLIAKVLLRPVALRRAEGGRGGRLAFARILPSRWFLVTLLLWTRDAREISTSKEECEEARTVRTTTTKLF